MKCSSCTTELWGRPAVCPVCGAPTGLSRRSPRQTPPPWTPNAPAAPAPPPQRTPSQSQPFFNASDLLDPEVLNAVPQAPPETGAVDIFSTGPLSDDAHPSAQQGMINAADLFDPQVLADLTGSGSEERSFQNQAEAPARDNYPPFFNDNDARYPDQGNYPPPAPPPLRATGKGPIAAPLFSLSALPATGPQPSMPPMPPPFPPRDLAPDADLMDPDLMDAELMDAALMDEPDEENWRLQNGYRIVSGPPPLGAPPSRPPMSASSPYPVAPYPMPAAPASKAGARPRPRKGRPFFSTMGGFLSLLLVILILGSAIFFGAQRYFQLQALQQHPTKTTVASLPTVAPKAGYTILPDQTLGISLQYSDSWQKQTDRDKNDPTYQGILLYTGTNPGFSTGFEMGSSPQYATLSPLQIDNYVLANPFPLTTITSIQTFPATASTIHINDLNWIAEDANITNNGVNLRMTCLAILHNGHGYVIFYFSRQEVFSNTYSQFFQPMLISFRFLNG